MSSHTQISAQTLFRRVGTPDAPVILDVRIPEDFAADPRLIPGTVLRDFRTVAEWADEFAGKHVVVSCQKGLKLSQGVAALLAHAGAEAEVLEGGFVGWRDAGLPLLTTAKVPPQNYRGSTLWVTRQRPKVDRIACPWLIRRFVDPGAVFMFVEPKQVEAVAERFGATPFDIEGVFWSHRGPLCTFDTMLDEFGLRFGALDHLSRIVRGADTADLAIEPEAAGFLAISLGLSRMYRDDLEQLDAGMLIYDALYRWCRDATEETHNWPAPGGRA
jgi:rhodanese-related sulfurtransferase